MVDADANNFRLPARQSAIVTARVLAADDGGPAAGPVMDSRVARSSVFCHKKCVLRSVVTQYAGSQHYPANGTSIAKQRCQRVATEVSSDNRMVLSVLSALRSTSAIDCQVPSARPPPSTGIVA